MLRSAKRARRLGRAAFGSLERRLVGGLLLIVIATLVLQLTAQERSYRLHHSTQDLRTATLASERAAQLINEVSRLRSLTQRRLADLSERDASEEIIDAAMAIEESVNGLRLAGIPVHRLRVAPEFFGIDRHVEQILSARSGAIVDEAALPAIDERNRQLAEGAATLHRVAETARFRTTERLNDSAHDWHMVTSAVGALTILLVAAILFDLLCNVVPALRRMHASLKRLADGDLDVEVGRFDLAELQALSGALETFRKNALAVRDLAYTDPATGLPNRRAFETRAKALIAASREARGRGHAVLLADLDRFKDVNDDYGHAVGDQLVRLIGDRMKTELGDRALVARVGGDEFAILAPLEGNESSTALASDLVAAMRQPFRVGDYQLSITLSAGLVSSAAIRDNDVSGLLNRAELALNAAKQNGRNRAVVFTPDLEEEREVERVLERDLASALRDGGLRMVYQPILPVDAAGTEVEALVRWRHPSLGEISPARFIPAAERSGLMVQLGEWIIERALSDLRRWPDMMLSINLSPMQLQQDGFAGFLTECCRINGITANRLTLEVTESLSIERNTRALLTLNLLRTLGFRIALDDFGTGYSSLCMMKTFRFDRLKLDRSLISDLEADPASVAVLDAAVTMALRIGAEVVAEGISAPELVQPVCSAGCTHLQGFYYSKPIEVDDVAAFYAEPLVARRVA